MSDPYDYLAGYEPEDDREPELRCPFCDSTKDPEDSHCRACDGRLEELAIEMLLE